MDSLTMDLMDNDEIFIVSYLSGLSLQTWWRWSYHEPNNEVFIAQFEWFVLANLIKPINKIVKVWFSFMKVFEGLFLELSRWYEVYAYGHVKHTLYRRIKKRSKACYGVPTSSIESSRGNSLSLTRSLHCFTM